MAGNNFSQFIRIGNALKQQRESARKMWEIGVFAQEIENELMEGHIFVYPSIRVLLEGIFDLLIKHTLNLTIEESDNGKTRKQIYDFLDNLKRQNKVRATLKNSKLQVQPHAFSLSVKRRVIERCFEEAGVNTDHWHLKAICDGCSERAHQIRVPPENDKRAINQLFTDRFTVLGVIHSGIYSHLLQALLGGNKPEQYAFPDIDGITEKYQQRTKQYFV